MLSRSIDAPFLPFAQPTAGSGKPLSLKDQLPIGLEWVLYFFVDNLETNPLNSLDQILCAI